MAPQQHIDRGMAERPGEQAKALWTVRILWAALLMGQLIFLGVIVVVWETNPSFQPSPDVVKILFPIVIGMLLVGVPIGYVWRGQVYKRYWQDNVVAPQGYVGGNLFLLALCEGISLFGLATTMLNGSLWPTVVPSVIAMAVQVVNWPNGQAMVPVDPVFDRQ